MLERWIAIPGWEGLYEASDLGRIRSVDRIVVRRDGVARHHAGRIRIPRKATTSNHYLVGLKRPGLEKRFYVHTLVLLAFKGPRPKDRTVARHLNGDATDNRAANLVWGTHSENNYDQVRHGTHPEARKTHCPKGHPYSGENLYIGPNGARNCRHCNRTAAARYAARQKASVGSGS